MLCIAVPGLLSSILRSILRRKKTTRTMHKHTAVTQKNIAIIYTDSCSEFDVFWLVGLRLGSDLCRAVDMDGVGMNSDVVLEASLIFTVLCICIGVLKLKLKGTNAEIWLDLTVDDDI